MSKKIQFEWVEKCQSCDGTGIYVRYGAEKTGAGVICYPCNGTGRSERKYEHEYEEFVKKEKKDDIQRVFTQDYGFPLYPDDYYFKDDKRTIHYSKYGVSYHDWFEWNTTPKHVEELYCPHFVHRDHDGRCKILRGGLISGCKLYSEKDKCWEEYNRSLEDKNK